MKRFYFILLLLALSACATKKQVVYFQDVNEDVREIPPNFSKPNQIEPRDILRIRISALEGKSVLPFLFENGSVSGTGGVRGSSNVSGDRAKLNGYLVDQDGYINFPQLGKISMAGRTIGEAQKYLEKLLSEYIKNPTVSVRLVNFKVAVLGQVKSPQVITTDENSITLPEALARAGDLSIDGKRDNVLIIRHEKGKRIFKRIDLTTSNWMDSPYYNLKQDDIVYVEPNRPAIKRAGQIGSLSSLLGIVSVVLGIATVIILK